MKALRWHGRQDLRYEDIPEPSPAPGQLKIKVSLVGICGTDMKEYASGPVMIPADKVPLTMGHEFVGHVVDIGAGVTGFDIGDRVSGVGYWYCGQCYCCRQGFYNVCANLGFTGLFTEGCMAEYFVIPAYACYRLPPAVSDTAGAMVEPLAVALHAVRQGRVQLGDTVAVLGDGTIGLCALLAARVAGALGERGVRCLDAPVSGGDVGAQRGTLSIMVGGDEATFREVKPVFDVLGKSAVLCGPNGAGQTVKACNQVLVAVTIAGVSEALTLGAKAGVDPAKIVQVLGGGLARCGVLENRGQRMVQGDFEPGFRVNLVLKDIGLALGLGKEYSVPMPISASVEQRYVETKAAGHGEKSISSVILPLEKMMGVQVRTKNQK